MTMLAPRFYPLSAGLSRRLRLAPEAAPQELHPAEELDQPAAVFDPADWDRITAYQAETDAATEASRLAGGLRRHLPTTRRLLRDVLVTPVGLFTWSEALSRFGPLPWARLLRDRITAHDLGFWPASAVSLRYFGHFGNDALPASLLRDGSEQLVLPFDPSWGHAADWLRRLGETPDPQPLAFYRKLWICDDRGMNSHRRARTRALGAKLMAGLPPGPSEAVYLRRGGTGAARRLVNEDALSDRLAQAGFGICDLDQDAEALLRALSGARIVVTMEGSQWIHAHYAAGEGALIVTLNPADRFNTIAADMVPALSQRLATLVVEPREGGYHADPDRLLRLIDRAGV